MRRLVLFCALILVSGVLPAVSEAKTVTLRVESLSAGTLLPRTTVTLPTTQVAPSGALDGQVCPGDSVIGAVQTAMNGAWSGVWSDTGGWSLKQIKTVTADPANAPRQAKWLVMVNSELRNDPPCQQILNDGDSVLLYTACLPGATAFSGCFQSGPIEIFGPNGGTGSPGAPVHFTVWETMVTLNSAGEGNSVRGPSSGASVVGPQGSTTSDDRYGTGDATLMITTRGPADITASNGTHVPDRTSVCITDGADGFCGTTRADQNPFDPFAFCGQETNGSDGYCGSPDLTAPLGRISQPGNAATYGKGAGPKKFTGTVDFDPTLTDHVELRLMRQLTRKVVVRYKRRKVIVRKRVRGKLVRKRVVKRIPVKRTRKACYGWSDPTSAWKRLKICDAGAALGFRAEGAETWSYAFLSALPAGNYTLDALAQDGAGNTDTTRETGRNRVTFKVA